MGYIHPNKSNKTDERDAAFYIIALR